MDSITLQASETDDPGFIEIAGSLLNGAVALLQPDSVYVVRIDNWFGPKWLGFSGKMLGAVGVHNHLVTLPPFVPSRVTAQDQYTRDPCSGGYVSMTTPPLHKEQPSGENLQRHTDALAPGSALF